MEPIDVHTKTLSELNELIVTHSCLKTPESGCDCDEISREIEERMKPASREDIRMVLLELEKIQDLIMKAYFIIKEEMKNK